VREEIAKDFPGKLKQATAIGYQSVELCSFKGYAGFRPLADLKPADIRKIVQDVGMTAPSSHFQWREFDDATIDQSIEWSKGVGLQYMTMSMARHATTMDDWKQIFELMNKYGERIEKAGMILGYHTHNDEWKKIDGVMVFDQMLRSIDPKNCLYQLDMGGTSANGIDTGDYMASHPDRFFSLHLKDHRRKPLPGVAAAPPPPPAGGQPGPGKVPDSRAVGQGDTDWKSVFAGAKKGGIRNYFVEIEARPPDDPKQLAACWEAMKVSAEYLRKLKV
jgi:sugar phosphate isomerase/epimerase